MYPSCQEALCLLHWQKSLPQFSRLSITPLNSTRKSGHPAVCLSSCCSGADQHGGLLFRALFLLEMYSISKFLKAIWLFFSHTLCYLIETNVFFPNNFLPKYCWHGRWHSFMWCPVYFHCILCYFSISCNNLSILVQQVLSYGITCIQYRG